MNEKRKPSLTTKLKGKKNPPAPAVHPVIQAIQQYNKKASDDNLYSLFSLIAKEKIDQEGLKTFFRAFNLNLSSLNDVQKDNIVFMFEAEINKIETRIKQYKSKEKENKNKSKKKKEDPYGLSKQMEKSIQILDESKTFILNKIKEDQASKQSDHHNQVVSKPDNGRHDYLHLRKFVYNKGAQLKKNLSKTIPKPTILRGPTNRGK